MKTREVGPSTIQFALLVGMTLFVATFAILSIVNP